MKQLNSFFILYLFVVSVIDARAQGDIQDSTIISFFHDAKKVRQLIFSSNGKQLIVRSGEEIAFHCKIGNDCLPNVHVWDMETKQKVRVLYEKEFGRAACISRDGKLLAYREANYSVIWDINAWKVINKIQFNENRNRFARPLAFTVDNKSLILEQGDTCASYFVSTGQMERKFASDGLTRYLSSDDAFWIEGFIDSVRLSSFLNNKLFVDIPCKDSAKSELKIIYFSPNNQFFATHYGNQLKLWNAKIDNPYNTDIKPITIGTKEIFFGFSSDGNYYIVADKTVKLWDFKHQKEIVTPLNFESKVTATMFSPDGKYLAAGDNSGNIKIWHLTH
jgi:WD40 repeat protein